MLAFGLGERGSIHGQNNVLYAKMAVELKARTHDVICVQNSAGSKGHRLSVPKLLIWTENVCNIKKYQHGKYPVSAYKMTESGNNRQYCTYDTCTTLCISTLPYSTLP